MSRRRSTAGTALGNQVANALSRAGYPVFRQQCGLFRKLYSEEKVRIGINGMADYSGIIKGSGQRLEVEVKAGGDRLSEDQERWRDFIQSSGGIWIEARSAEQAVADVEEALGDIDYA